MSDGAGDGAGKGAAEGEAGKPSDGAGGAPARPPSFSPAPPKRNWGFASMGGGKAGMGGQQTLGARGGMGAYGPGGRNIPTDDAPEPQFDPVLLEKLGISHVNPYRIAQVLKDDDVTLEEIAEQFDMGMHLLRDRDDDTDYELAGLGWSQMIDDNQAPAAGGAEGPAAAEPAAPEVVEKKEPQWDPTMMKQLLPVRKFFPGTQYQPQDLSPEQPVDWNKIRRGGMNKGCPLGGKKGPRVDWCNGFLLSKYVTEGGNIKPRRATKVCAKKQRELAKAVRRARIMGILARTSKPNFGDNMRGFRDSD